MDNEMSVKRVKLMSLPEEILLETYKYLSTEDKKVVRLVCKRWFEICNSSSISTNEVLNCNGIYTSSNIYELLGGTKRQTLNLRFRNVKLLNDKLFWQLNGFKIRSIDFVDCKFEVGLLESIILHCGNLLDVSLIYSSQYDQDVLFLTSDLEKLSRTNIIRENLKSLEINLLDSRWISNYIVHNLLTIFTKIKILKISCTVVDTNFEEIELNLPELLTPNKFTFSPILNYLIVSRNQIESLKLHFPTNEFSINFIRQIFETLTTTTKLTKLSINMRGIPLLEWIELFIRSKHLISLEYCIKMDCSSEKFLLQVLNNNLALKYLKVSFFNTLNITNICFEKLISSRLKSLNIDDTMIMLDSEFNVSKNLAPNTTLRDLCVYTERLQVDVQLFFLQYFQNLHHLELSNLTDDVLQATFAYQTKLRSLILHDCDFCSRHGFMGVDDGNQLTRKAYCYSFKRLSKLECLELLSCSAGRIFSKILPSDSILPNLKYLRVNINSDSKVNPTDLLATMDTMPLLEGFYLCYGDNTIFDIWLQICIKLRRLRYLYINSGIGEVRFDDSDYKKLFVVRPSLRALVHDSHSGQILASYYLNTIRKEVHLKSDNYVYPVCLPKIGDYIVHWMNF